MPTKDEIASLVAILITLAMFFLAVGYIFQAVAINTDRTSKLLGIQAQIQQKVNDIAKATPGSSPEELQKELSKLNDDRDTVSNEVLYGNLHPLSFAACFLPLNPDCFHRNSSEQNNLWIAIASGALGAVLFLLRGFRATTAVQNSTVQNAGVVISVICLIPTGMTIGLLTIFLLRGTKGALLTPIADVVQVENPYGIAFACTIAALFSDRIFLWLSRLLDVLPSPPPR
jgi:hypothetical protein